MQIRHVSVSPLEVKTDLLVICVLGPPNQNHTFNAVNNELGGLLKTLVKEERFEGKIGQRLLSDTRGRLRAKRITLLGGGNKRDFKISNLRNLAADGIKIATTQAAKKVCVVMPALSERQRDQATQFTAEGALLGAYRFDKYRSKTSKKPSTVKEVTVITEISPGKKGKTAGEKAARMALQRGRVVADAICRARDYVNEPAAFMTPKRMASIARALAKKHPRLRVKIATSKECEKLGMNMFLAVGKGSDEESQLIHLSYIPKKKAKTCVALIGKGVTFDSGGYSLKPSAGMEDMKMDMAGAATVVAAMGAIAELGSDCEVHGITACCENLVSGRAYKLGDVLKGMDGTTVEINNTDAEGRLTLGDAISYARTKVKPDEIFDFATLTGACMVALGPFTAGVLSPDDRLTKRWLAAASNAGEDMWRLPLVDRLKKQLKSNLAVMRNTGERWGGAITAGLFLKHFAKDTSWLHVDIAGPASANTNQGAIARGGTGFGVATIVEYLTH